MNPLLPMLGAFAIAMSTHTAPVGLDGAVNKPGELEISQPTKLKALLNEHGGLRKDADVKKIEIRSDCGSVRVVDLTRFDQDQTVKPGDSIKVPVINPSDYVFVSGGVQNASPVEYTQGIDILSVCQAAGMPKGVAKNQVKLTRIEAGKEKTYTVNLDDVERGLQANMVLKPADRVHVPYVVQRASDRQLLTIVVIGLLFLLIID